VSAQNKIQIDHNVKVSANDQLVWGNREKYPEIEGNGLVNVADVTLQEKQNVGQKNEVDSGNLETQTNKNKNNVDEPNSSSQEETPAGKIYFARVPSFYTFPDNAKKPVTKQKQLIKHAPKSVMEFLKLLKTYHNSVLTKDDIQEFKEFMIEKRPIPNKHLLRGKHAYNSHLRESLQSANIEEINEEKVMDEKESKHMDLGNEVDKEQEYFSEEEASILETGSGMDEEKEFSSEENVKNINDKEILSDTELDKEGEANSKQETFDAHYPTGERYLSENFIGIGEGDEIDLDKEEKSATLWGEHLPNINLEKHGMGFSNTKSTVKENSEKDTYSTSIEKENSKSVGAIEIPKQIEIGNNLVIDSDITDDNREEGGFKTKEADERVISKHKDIENDIAIDLDMENDDYEESSGYTTEEYKQQRVTKISNTNVEKGIYSEDKYPVRRLNKDENSDATEENLLKTSASHYKTFGTEQQKSTSNFEENSNLFSPYSLRYIKEGEIGKVEDEAETITKKRMKPVLRGQHLPETTLLEFSFNHISSDEDSLEGKDLEGSSLHNLLEEVEDTSLSFGEENTDKILKAQTKLENELVGEDDTDILYSKEVIGKERQYFAKNIKKDKSLNGRHPLLASHQKSYVENSDQKKDVEELADKSLDIHDSLMEQIIVGKVNEIVNRKVKEHYSIEDIESNENVEELADKSLDIHDSLMEQIIVGKVNEIVNRKVKEYYSKEDIESNENEDVNWYVNIPAYYSTGKRYLEDIEEDDQTKRKKQEDRYVPLNRGHHRPKHTLEESDLKQVSKPFKADMEDIPEKKNISDDITEDEMHEKDNYQSLASDFINTKPHKKKDNQKTITDQRINEDKQVIPPNVFAQSINRDEEKDDSRRNVVRTKDQKLAHEDKDRVPLRVFGGSKEKIDGIKSQKKEKRWDGPHPFRSICRLFKCFNV